MQPTFNLISCVYSCASLHMGQGEGCIMHEIFFMKFLVIILGPVLVH